MLGKAENPEGKLLAGACARLDGAEGGKTMSACSAADGIFRIPEIPQGKYQFKIELAGYAPLSRSEVVFNPGEALTIAVKLYPEGSRAPDAGSANTDYRELTRLPAQNLDQKVFSPEAFPDTRVMSPKPDRWNTNMPAWSRYTREGEFPYTSSHWWDPYNQNRLKGDKPVFGQETFFKFTGTSTTAFDGRRLFVPSGVSAANAGSSEFFGRGGQALVQETIRLSFDLFHGDTSFKPVDWQVKITPAFNINQLWTREQGVVNIDVREGTARTDGHVAFQEAFVEKKLADLGPAYDFVSIRAGVQQFSSDFRGLIFAQEQPGVRIFGNLHSNRLQYNAAYFFFLEKDTNSGLNTFHSRHQPYGYDR
jgi:hypothetical protein